MLGQAIYGYKIALPRPTGNSKGDYIITKSCVKKTVTQRPNTFELKFKESLVGTDWTGSTLPRSLENDLWAKRFGVDGLPHVAFIDSQHRVQTALVGDVPPNVVRADVEALIKGGELPFIMYDAFQGQNNILQ